MAAKAAAALVGGVQHGAGEAGLMQPIDQREIRRLIGEEHGDDARAACRLFRQGGDAGEGIAAREQADLDDVDSEGGDPVDGIGDEPAAASAGRRPSR